MYTNYTVQKMTKPDNNKPYPVKLGELKPFLQMEVVDGKHKSLHYLIKKILGDYKIMREAKVS